MKKLFFNLLFLTGMCASQVQAGVTFITSNTTWNGSNFTWARDEDYVVTADVTLTITGVVEVDNSGTNLCHLAVLKGGKIVMDGGTLTTKVNNPRRWSGIYVDGDNALDQNLNVNTLLCPNQGVLLVKKNSLIENAVFGIHTADITVGGSSINIGSKGGGIVRMENSTIKNCVYGVYFHPYTNSFNSTNSLIYDRSYIAACNFESNDRYAASASVYRPLVMVRTEQTYGIKIWGSTFTDNSSQKYDKRTDGIQIYKAYTFVTGCNDPRPQVYVPGGPLPAYRPICQSPNQNFFSGLYRGVYLSGGGVYSSIVDNNSFKGCYFGVSNVGFDNTQITRNNISSYPSDNTAVGIKVENSMGFKVEQNDIDGAGANATSAIFSYGISVLNAGTANNQIYNNTIKNCAFAGDAKYTNGSVSFGNTSGLQFLCNQISGSSAGSGTLGYDLTFTGQVNPNQGMLNKSAGNTFTSGAWNIKNNNTSNISYYYDNGSNRKPTLTSNSNLISAQVASLCPTSFGFPRDPIVRGPISPNGNSGGFGLTAISSPLVISKLSSTELSDLTLQYACDLVDVTQMKLNLAALMDGGNPNAIRSDVATALSSEAWQLRNELLGASPYLSHEVLRTAIDRNDILPLSILLEILAANPDGLRSGEIFQYLEEQNIILPQWMMTILENATGTITARTLLEQAIAAKQNEMNLICYTVIDDMLYNDTEVPVSFNHTAYRGWLSNLNNIQADYRIVEDYIATGNYSGATNILNNLSSTYTLTDDETSEYANLQAYYAIMLPVYQEGLTIHDLSAVKIALLGEIANGVNDRARGLARAALAMCTDTRLDEMPLYTEPSYKKEKTNRDGLAAPTALATAFPNPAHDLLSITVTLPATQLEGVIELSDISGRVIEKTSVTTLNTLVNFNTSKLPAGTYLYSLRAGTKVISTSKVEINH